MEKEELLTRLQGEIGKPDANGNYGITGISQRTLDAYIDGILPTLGENVDDAVIGTHASILKSIGGQIRHEKAEFVKGYKSNSTSTSKDDTTKGGEDGDSEIMKLLKQISSDNLALKERLDKRDKEAEQASIKARVIDGLKAKNANDEYVLKNCLKGVVFDTSKSVDELVEEYISIYDAEYKEARGNSEPPRSARSAGKGNEYIDSFFEEMKKKGKF